RTEIPNRDDLTAVTYDATLNRLFIIADSKDRLAMLTLKGDEEAEIVLPGVQQEGISFDADGNLWIADDRAGVLIFRDARRKIEAEMKQHLGVS
ncbi:MAG: SdiA-regulated domain-containing protein, partial [Vicinamibacteria bacterium]